jgi:CheY-like chemotaxis protein
MAKSVLKALVIDDNEVNSLILANMLLLFGIHADQSYQGKKAVSLTQNTKYDIIFIDHIMPDMDGIQTTAAIRSLSAEYKKSVIIALTSELTEQIRSGYIEAGADDLYKKPLSLPMLTSIMNRWFPQISVEPEYINKFTGREKSNQHLDYFLKDLLRSYSDDIDYEKGISYMAGDTLKYINILELSWKDMQSAVSIIINGHNNNSMNQLKFGAHKLRNILENIGAVNLSERTCGLEQAITRGDKIDIDLQFDALIETMEYFKQRLADMLVKYHDYISALEREQRHELIPMTKEEYEQSLFNTIYYIRRYEYDFAAKELERLALQGKQEWKQELELAIMNIKEFNYEKALTYVMDIKNKTGILPVLDINKEIQLNNFWD